MMRRAHKSWFLITVLFLLGTACATYQLSRSRTYQLLGEIISRVDVSEPVVALTLDDGPYPEHLDEVLATLQEKDVRATFFLIGQDIVKYPDEARRIVRAGHEVGNHSYSHARMLFQGRNWMREELTRTDDALRAAGWTRTPLFRPPFGKKLLNLPWVLKDMNRTTITWDVEPDSDPAIERSPFALADHAVARSRPGSIILLHVLSPSREAPRQALRPMIDGLRNRGFKFVTLSDLLARRR